MLLVDKQFFIGLTARTDEQGIREFAAAVEPHGYQVAAIEVSAGLHLKIDRQLCGPQYAAADGRLR
ncbi:NG,NG-dimethylarginine dimethylaminohydrolase 1 [Klebsiella michiganensis]|nr:NG,NG-dimethylarginine dimethylaminohydrolase 1 [Klebsiella michiganensis]